MFLQVRLLIYAPPFMTLVILRVELIGTLVRVDFGFEPFSEEDMAAFASDWAPTPANEALCRIFYA